MAAEESGEGRPGEDLRRPVHAAVINGVVNGADVPSGMEWANSRS
jgi:hypothetical protein